MRQIVDAMRNHPGWTLNVKFDGRYLIEITIPSMQFHGYGPDFERAMEETLLDVMRWDMQHGIGEKD